MLKHNEDTRFARQECFILYTVYIYQICSRYTPNSLFYLKKKKETFLIKFILQKKILFYLSPDQLMSPTNETFFLVFIAATANLYKKTIEPNIVSCTVHSSN